MSGTFIEITDSTRQEAKLTLLQGKTINFNLTIEEDGSPIDVTSYDAKLCVKADIDDAADLATFTTGNSRVIIGSTDGIIQFTMTSADSAALTSVTNGWYEIEITDDSSEVTRGLYGRCDIIAEVCD